MRALFVALALAPSSAWAYECLGVDEDPDIPVAWADRTVGYAVTESAGLSFQDVDAAFSAWEAVPCSDVAFTFEGVVTANAEPQVVLDAVRAGWVETLPEALALTTLEYSRSDGRIQSAVILLNLERFALEDATTAACDDRLHDLRSVLTHEVGHLLGLGHTTEYSGASTDPTMAPRVDPCDVSKRDLAADDVAAICALYPIGGRGACHGRAVRAGAPDAGGCTTSGASPHLAALALVLLGLNTCRKPRSGG